MSLVWFDGFDHLAFTTGGIAGLYDGFNNPFGTGAAAGGRFGTGQYFTSQSGGAFLEKWLTSQSTYIVGCAMMHAGITDTLMQFYNGTSQQCYAQFDSATKHIKVFNQPGTLLAESTRLLITGVWWYVEIKVVFHSTAGSVTIKVDGVTEVTATNVNTAPNVGNAATRVRLQTIVNGGTDDWYICNGQGTVNNDFLGDVRVVSKFPNGAGNYTQWTPSTGSNYQNVDETTPNDDTDYNSTSTAANKDSFAYGDLSNVTAVYGVMPLVRHKKDDAGTRTIRGLTRISSTDYSGTTYGVADSYVYTYDIYENSPATSNPWTQTEFNGTEFGYEMVS